MLTLPVDRSKCEVYADRYAQWKITGTRYLALRDIPAMVREHAKAGTAALDYGCGAGASTQILADVGLRVDGVDINEHMLNQARLRMPAANFRLVENGRIPATNDHYDLVFCSWVLILVGSKRKMVDIIREINRVLKPNGTFMALVCSEEYYNRDWLSENTEFEVNKSASSGDVVKGTLKDIDLTLEHYFWTDNDYREVIEEAGLSLVETHRPLGTNNDGYPWVTEKLHSPATIYVAKKKSN